MLSVYVGAGRPVSCKKKPVVPVFWNVSPIRPPSIPIAEKQSLLAGPRTDARLVLELRLLRKEIVLLKSMVAHAATAAKVQTSLNPAVTGPIQNWRGARRERSVRRHR